MPSQVEILLVEDNRSDADLTIRALKKYNLTNHIVHLKDGQEAMDFIFCNGEFANKTMEEQRPKMILLDLKMPKINGLEVLEAIRTDVRTKTIPVVVLTSSREHPDVEKAYELGVNSYIVKPVQFDAFMEAVKEIGMYWMLLNTPPEN
ncbi:MAG: response regulator [Flavobacteriales bacterium]|nr:response regulator [Flavobacteriales bacterium]